MRSRHDGRTTIRDRADFHYCLSRLDGVIVDKTHIPYELSPPKLDRIRSLFLEPKWDVNRLTGIR